jgi:hypothetical protein
MVKPYGRLQNSPIICIQPTKDGKHLITAGSQEVKTISIEGKKVERNYGCVEGNGAYKMAIFPDCEKLLLGDKGGNLVMTYLKFEKFIKNFGRPYEMIGQCGY